MCLIKRVTAYNYRWHDEFISEQADCREGTVSKKRQGGERVDSCVDISEPLKPLELSFLVAIYEGTVVTKEDFNGT